MKCNRDERKEIIMELQKVAKDVSDMKITRRQKRPIVIEFSGSPKAGKTSCINSLELFLKRNNFRVRIIHERASVCPVSDKHSPMFNIWTTCMGLTSFIETMENKDNDVDVLLIDRGIFDALCWFEWLVTTNKMEEEQRRIAESFFLLEEFVKNIDIVFAFCVKPEVSIEREYANLLTDKPGTIMNKTVLNEYLCAIQRTINAKKGYFHKVFEIDTENKNQDEVGKEVTSMTLDNLKSLLMERIGYFRKTTNLLEMLKISEVCSYDNIKDAIPHIEFGLRDNIENDSSFLQPIPVAVITNHQRNKILVIKKNKAAVGTNSPEKDKNLIYVGGHTRYEDQMEENAMDFLGICRTTLRREIKEEIGISVAINNAMPYFMYDVSAERSMNHLAVCFLLEVDDESIRLHLDSHELILNKGRSKSGRFLSVEELKELELEAWSKRILKYFFRAETEQLCLDLT